MYAHNRYGNDTVFDPYSTVTVVEPGTAKGAIYSNINGRTYIKKFSVTEWPTTSAGWRTAVPKTQLEWEMIGGMLYVETSDISLFGLTGAIEDWGTSAAYATDQKYEITWGKNGVVADWKLVANTLNSEKYPGDARINAALFTTT